MEVELYNEDKHYPIVCRFWEDRDIIPVQSDFLPKYGLVMYDKDIPICSAFLYRTDSKLCIFEHFLASKDLKGKKLYKCALNMARAMEDLVKYLGYDGCVLTTDLNGVGRIYKKMGYEQIGGSMKFYTMRF